MITQQDRHVTLATELVLRTETLADDLLESKDLLPYLRLMVQFPEFSVVNLLLIWEQYPRATFLARGSFWRDSVEAKNVLQPEWEGKGIDLVLPALSGNSYIGYATRFYDVRQIQDGSPGPTVARPFDPTDIQNIAAKILLSSGDFIDPDETLCLESDYLFAPEDSATSELSAWVYRLATLLYDDSDDPEFTPLAALLTQCMVMACGLPPPMLTEEGRATLAPEEPITWFTLLQQEWFRFESRFITELT